MPLDVSTEKSAGRPVRREWNAIRSPAGNQLGYESKPGSVVSARACVPSARISQMSAFVPANHLMKAISLPFGETAGEELRALSDVNGTAAATGRRVLGSSGSASSRESDVSAAYATRRPSRDSARCRMPAMPSAMSCSGASRGSPPPFGRARR